MSTTRRGVLAALGAGALGGCGFHPLYMPAGGRGSVAGNELAAIYVPVQGERLGQLLRQALQRRVEGSGTGIAKRYDLVAPPALAGEGIAIQRDSSTTRIRLVASTIWTLRQLDIAHTVLGSGTVRVVDGYNINNQEYFAADLASETVQRRMMEALADQVVLQVAVFLRRRAANPATPAPVPTAAPAAGIGVSPDLPLPGALPDVLPGAAPYGSPGGQIP